MDSLKHHHAGLDSSDSDAAWSDTDTSADDTSWIPGLAPLSLSSGTSVVQPPASAVTAVTSQSATSALNSAQIATVAYLSGVTANGTIAGTSYAAWNGDNPATYTSTSIFAHKWDNNAAGNTLASFSAAGTGGGTVTYAFDPASNFTAAQEQAFVAGFTLWSDEANITFKQVTYSTSADVVLSLGSGTGTFEQGAPQFYATAGSSSIPDNLTPGYDQVDTQAGITFDTSGGFGTLGSFTLGGGYSYSAVIHEIGHLVGLGHSGPYNDGSGVASLAPQLQFNAYDSRQWSVMSYIDPSDKNAAYYNSYTVTGTSWTSTVGNMIYQVAPVTPMPLDILAVQQLYGAPVSTALSGGQVFGFNSNITDASEPFFDFTKDVTPVVTLWDAGGNNTLDLSGYSTGATVDLLPGTFSSAGGLTNNIGIAYGTAIDNAVGTTGNDTFIVNADSDKITGDGGTDTVVFADPEADYTISGNETDATVTLNATGLVDTLLGISTLKFSDTTVNMPCYCRGTRVLTDQGEVAVEDLSIGDFLVTRTGAARKLRWIGRRQYAGRFLAANLAVSPVLIRAGAIADGVPKRDLYVSPLHAMYFDDMLIPAASLVNGTSIVQLRAAERVEYFHLELDTHDVIVAEGALSESFVDDDGRFMFHNASEYEALYPGAARPPAQYCARRVSSGYELAAIRQNLAVRAGLRAPDQGGRLRGFIDRVGRDIIEGWAQNPDQPDVAVCLDVVVEGIVVAQTLANRFRPGLAAAISSSGRQAFSVRLPRGLTPAQRATVSVRRSCDNVPLPRHVPALAQSAA